VALAGIALTGIVAAGAIDLSIGAILAVAGVVFGALFHHGAPPAVCFAGCFATAWLLLAFDGFLIRALKIPAIILTLAGLSFYRGLALVLAEVSIDDFGGSLAIQNEAYQSPGKLYAGSILLFAVAVALLWDAFGKTPRTWLALGCSAEACRLQGLRPGRVLQSAYWAGGFFLGLAALVDVTNRQIMEPARHAQDFELDVIGAVVLGGTNIFLGAFLLYFVREGLVYAGVGEYYRRAVQGAVIILVIGVNCALNRRRKLLSELK
jgi:ribose/xylose/arabinose/galactoside ABC-type transport system permease subunit